MQAAIVVANFTVQKWSRERITVSLSHIWCSLILWYRIAVYAWHASLFVSCHDILCGHKQSFSLKWFNLVLYWLTLDHFYHSITQSSLATQLICVHVQTHTHRFVCAFRAAHAPASRAWFIFNRNSLAGQGGGQWSHIQWFQRNSCCWHGGLLTDEGHNIYSLLSATLVFIQTSVTSLSLFILRVFPSV